MRDFLRRWLGITEGGAPENRGTLTFTRDGLVVLGVAHNTSGEMALYSRRVLEDGLASRNPIVLPFPVDVVDLRKP